MNTNTMELNLNEMEMINGGWSWKAFVPGAVIGGIGGLVIGAVSGGIPGAIIGTVGGAVVGGVITSVGCGDVVK